MKADEHAICRMSATALVAAIRARTLTATRVMEAHLSRTAVQEPLLNTYAALDVQGALQAAWDVDRQLASGSDPGPLAGLPVSVKDLIAVGGMRQAFGSRLFRGNVAAEDAPSVARLRAAGACITGKSTTSELGAKAVGDSPLTGATRNPWDTSRTAGGSSAGAAAGVAAGLVPLALGTDGGGSIRIPASMCGLVGFKATFGRVPVWPPSATPSVAHVAPMARSIEDAALLLGVIAGHDARDPGSMAEPAFDAKAHLHRDVQGLRIGWVGELGYGRVDPEVADTCRQALQRMAGAGVRIVPMPPLFAEDPHTAWNEVFYGAIGERIRAHAGGDFAGLDIDAALKRVLLARVPVSPETVARMREACLARIERAFADADILALPTLPTTAPAVGVDVPPGHDGRNPVDWSYFTYPFNLCGHPAASLPAGLSAGGMPIGIQFVARRGEDGTLLAAAAAFARACPFTGSPPV